MRKHDIKKEGRKMIKKEKARCVSAKVTTGLAVTLLMALFLGGSALGEDGLEEAARLNSRVGKLYGQGR